jgi:hypothetical protein
MVVFGALIEEVRFAVDSPVEGEGFEPSVPLESGRAERSNKPSCQPGKAVVSAAFGRASGEMAERADQRTPPAGGSGADHS